MATTDTNQTTRRTTGDWPVSETVVNAVAAAKGIDPFDLKPPLYSVLDPEALDELFRSEDDGTMNGEGRVSFVLADCEVIVWSDGRVLATVIDEEGSTTSVQPLTD